MFYYVYLLYSLKDGQFYTGMTKDLRRRVGEHEEGRSISTRYRRPLKLIYFEAYLLKKDAQDREKYLKTSMGRRVIWKQLNHLITSGFKAI